MNPTNLASGDNNVSLPTSPRYVDTMRSVTADNIFPNVNDKNSDVDDGDENITSQVIEDNEVKLKARIAQCKNIIESLKLQLIEEKAKIKTENKSEHLAESSPKVPGFYDSTTTQHIANTSMYSASVNSKLCYDDTLIEYEKQLQKYQNTLNMAQNEKKNAIRKQMMAKAFKLKLMEVENQCNIELLRVKQSLQCLEPLQMIANKWKTTSEDNVFDANTYELMPNFLELKSHSGSDVNSYKEEPCHILSKDDSALSE